MSDSNLGGQWAYSQSLNAYYYHDRQRDVYVLSDGRSIPVQAIPRATAQQPATPQTYPRQVPANASYTASPPSSAAAHNDLTHQLGNLNLGTTSGPGHQRHPRDGNETDLREDEEPPVVRAHNSTTQVTTVVQRAPAQDITDPSLFAVGVGAHRRLLGSNSGDEEIFDPAYRLRGAPKRFFIIGRVFLILWAEPAGESIVSGRQTAPAPVHIKGRYGQQVFSKVRRFVVIRENDRSCSALPILTYSGRGALQRNQREHGIIYTGNQAPTRPQYEPDLQPIAIRVDPDKREDKLNILSRVNYGNVYTIEHNLKVKPYGMVNRDSMLPLLAQFGDVWISKVGQRTGQSPQLVQALRPDLYGGRLDAVGSEKTLATPSQSASRPGLTPIQESAYERHAPMATAAHRSGASLPRRRPGSTASGETRLRSGGVETVPPSAAAGEISQEAREALNNMYERHRGWYLDNGYGSEEADAAAEAHIRTEVDKLRFGGTRTRSHRSASSASAGPRTSTGGLAPSSGAARLTSTALPTAAGDRRASISQGARSSPASARPTANWELSQSPQVATKLPVYQATASTSQPADQESAQDRERRARETAAIRVLVGEGWSSESANLIMRAMQRGYPLKTAKRIARKVERGASLQQAIYLVNEEDADASLHAPGRGKGRALD